ncbi:septum site-determining protein MinC [Oharaeibacter diazotrophicus]|uniref:Probable septum site-determining protein MinC n=2 Tax=Oharaeibacter diazotrophicus TaxID=1920512 RepID=A0A4R6R7J2_9HYPH|nr:septum site-determining protein MinC [Oharaeibacter diazotrophicus]TDP81879.1 septum site-determining protein MinC [Oharaeibacter diazotrophicus]BBE73511.1 septum site-determining protein MinC [Pleomorphomonas sp. SM30]GLS75300.1 putative septum site-determining protein MinC [Oharaeibacter diazotrophicus]
MDTATTIRKTIRFRGRSFLALVLAPEAPLAAWLTEFDVLRERSPSFFVNRPLVLDVGALDLDREALQTLVADLYARKVRVLGIEGAKASALGFGLPPGLSGGRVVDDIPAPEDETPAVGGAAAAPAGPPPQVPVPAVAPALYIEAPVRSGQSVMYPEGDVTIVGSVASGAEIVAGGSIHVYGALRGRAMAGCTGNPKARIFAQKFEAELVAIDGLYQIADELNPELRGRPVQIRLEDDTIYMSALD